MRRYVIILIALLSASAWANGRAPDKKKTSAEKPSHTLKDAERGANQALDSVDQGVHKGLSAAKEGAEEALQAVDKGVHKVIGSDKK